MLSLLIAVTVVSHVPQYIRIYAFQSSAGISPTSTLLLALAAQTQVVQMYYLFAIHPDTRYGNVVPKPMKPRQWLDLAQIVVQWICSVILCVSWCTTLKHPTAIHLANRTASCSSSPSRRPQAASYPLHPRTTHHWSPENPLSRSSSSSTPSSLSSSSG